MSEKMPTRIAYVQRAARVFLRKELACLGDSFIQGTVASVNANFVIVIVQTNLLTVELQEQLRAKLDLFSAALKKAMKETGIIDREMTIYQVLDLDANNAPA